MMDFLIGWQNYETEYKEKTVTMQLRSLKRDAHMVLVSHMDVFKTLAQKARMAIKKKAKTIDINPEDTRKMSKLLDDFAPFFPKYVRNIEGITINGQPPTPEMIFDEAVFSSLVTDIISQLTVITALSQADEKN